MTRAIIYTRVSTEAQRQNQSLERQLTQCRQYADREEFTIVAEVCDVASGANLDRPGLMQVWELIKVGQTDALIIQSLDRLTRSVMHNMLLRDDLKNAGVELFIAGREGGLDDSEIDALDVFEVAFAEYERLLYEIEDYAAGAKKAAKGHALGCGVAPYGYQYVGEPGAKELVPNPAEAPIVETIFRTYLAFGTRWVLDYLHENSIPCASARGDRPAVAARRERPAAVWARASIYKILRNPVHIGEFHDHGATINVEPTIDMETWSAVQEKLDVGQAIVKRYNRAQYLFKSRIRCACGYAAVGNTMAGKYRYYVCCAVSTRGTDTIRTCRLPRFRADAVDEHVLEWLISEGLNEEAFAEATGNHNCAARQKRATLDAQLKRLYETKLEIENEIRRFYERFGKGKMTDEQLDQAEAPRLKAIEQCDNEIVALREQDAHLPRVGQSSLQSQIEIYRQRLADAASDEEKRAIIDELDVRAMIGIDKLGRYVDVHVGFTNQTRRLRIE